MKHYNWLIRINCFSGFIAGVINKNKLFHFERMLWRIGRGNIYIRQADIDKLITDPATVSRDETLFTQFKSDRIIFRVQKLKSPPLQCSLKEKTSNPKSKKSLLDLRRIRQTSRQIRLREPTVSSTCPQWCRISKMLLTKLKITE